MEIISNGKGKAILRRNKRKGLKLKINFGISYPSPFRSMTCHLLCQLNGKDCLDICKKFERIIGTREFWFEIDEDNKEKRE